MKKAKIYLNTYSQIEFEKGVQEFMQIWKNIKTTTTYANFDAVYNKYQIHNGIAGKSINLPILTSSDLQSWIYMKK